jgi:hypothetical protein
MSPTEVIKAFTDDTFRKSDDFKLLMGKVAGVAHLGLVADDLDAAVLKLQAEHPERGYALVQKFPSVGIPKNFEGSEAEIGQVKAGDASFPALELFSVTWRGKYQTMDDEQRKKMIEHIALSVPTAQDVQWAIDMVSSKNKCIASKVAPQLNERSGEFFGYVINDAGNKLEFVALIGGDARSPLEE